MKFNKEGAAYDLAMLYAKTNFELYLEHNRNNMSVIDSEKRLKTLGAYFLEAYNFYSETLSDEQ